MAANFELWKFNSLVAFARDTTKRIAELEAENAELATDRRDLFAALRKLLTQESQHDTRSQDEK